MTAQTSSPQMSSFPKFIRKSEQSTRGLDGAFPPFKIEHRYKSVYERAGFDVNKGGNGTHHSNDSRSLTSRKARNPYSNNNNSSSSNNVNTRLQDDSPAGSPVLQKNRAPSLPINSQMRHNSQPNSDSDSPSASSHSSKTSSVNSNFTNSKSSSSRSTFRNTDEFSPVFEQPLTTGSSTTTFFNDSNEPENKTQSYQPPVISPNNNNNTTNAHDEQGPDQFDFSPSSNHSRNQKNLKLDLNNDNISDTQSLPGISKVESQQHTITNQSLHSAGSNGTAQTHQQIEPQQVPTITINEEQQRQQEEKPKDIYAQQGFQVAPPSQPANAAPPAKFDPRKQRSIRGHPTTQQGQGQQQRVPYPPNGDGQVTAQTVPYPGNAHQTRVMSPTGVQTRNMSPTSMHHQTRNMSPTGTQHPMPPHPHHRNGSRPSSPKLGGANGAHVPQLPMMSLNSPTSAYRPSQRPQSPVLPTGFQDKQQQQHYHQTSPPQAVYSPHNHHQHQQQPQQPVEPPRTRQQATYSQIRDDKLSSALNDFKNDVENHKTGGSGAGRSPTGSNTSLDDDEIPSSSTPSDLGLYKSDSKEDSSNDNSRFSYGNNLNGGMKDGFDPSAQFQNFASQQVAKDANLNNEYAEFLASQNNEQDQTKKNTHLSMVSSILSKASGNSEDDEIERELERQLQSLKMSGSTIDISKTESNNSRNSFGYGANSANGGVIPSFNIQDVDEVDEEEEEYTKPLSISGTYSFIEKSATTGEEDDEMTRPLTIHSRESNEESEPQPQPQVQQKQVQFETPYPQDESYEEEPIGDDTIDMDQEDDAGVRPLSPKTHYVEQELKNMNFKIQETDESPSVYIQEAFKEEQPPQEEEEEEGAPFQERSFVVPDQVYPVQEPILEPQPQAPYPTNETTPEPEPEHDHHHDLPQPTIYAPGSGPCRTCHASIDPHTTSKQHKPIYSKTGELSGQWHRQCFICTSPSCTVQFSKNVQCYVYNDAPYCSTHYHILNNSVCKSCHSGIEGRCISNELDEKWHLACLNCCRCRDGIRSDYFIVNGTNIMCSNCMENMEDNSGGLSVADRIEKRRTRIFNV